MSKQTDDGSILLIVAFSMVVLFGMAALSIDASNAYDIRNRLAAAADHGAKSAAHEIWRGNAANYVAFANQAIDQQQLSGQIPVTTARVIRLCSDAGATCEPAHQTNQYVEVILSTNYGLMFGALVSQFSLTPGARAVAGTGNSPFCLITLDDASPSLEIGNSEITATGCAVQAGGPISGSNPNAEIHSDSVAVAGDCSGNCDGFDNLTLNTPPPNDPLAGHVPVPPDCNPKLDIDQVGGVLPGGCYNNVTLDGTVTLSGGEYQIYGTVFFKNNTQVVMSPNTGFMYFGPAATFDFRQNTSLQVTAAVGGPYNGIAVFVDPANTSDWDMRNSSAVNVTGAFYAPNTNVIFANHLNSASTCTLFIVGTLDIRNGDGQMGNQCSQYGGSPLTSVSLAE